MRAAVKNKIQYKAGIRLILSVKKNIEFFNIIRSVGIVSKPVREFVRPFVVPAEDRVKAVTNEMEMAAILYLAEAERRKSKGRILKKPFEKLVFIAEACYPIWMIPWRGRTLLFDGLGFRKNTFNHNLLPDVRIFSSEIQESAEAYECYSVSLTQNANYFQTFTGKEEITIEGLITDPEFVEDFLSYLLQVGTNEKTLTTKVVLSPTINESKIGACVKELVDYRSRTEEEVKDLRTVMKLLSKSTGDNLKALSEKIKEIKEEFEAKTRKVTPKITEKTKQIQRRYKEAIASTSKDFDGQLQLLYKDRVKLEKTQERLVTELERCNAEIKTCRLSKDEGGEIHYNQKVREIRRTLPTLERDIKDLDKKIEQIEINKKLEISQRRKERDTNIEEAMKILRELEASQEASIRMTQQETTTLEQMTSTILDQIDKMTNLKGGALNEIDNLGAPTKIGEDTLVYLPFYLICYQTELRKRFFVYSPSTASSMGILTKLKGVFGSTKMKTFLQPRSKAITSLLNELLNLPKENPLFEKEICDAGTKVSILRTNDLRRSIRKGLMELRDEKWISDSEIQTLSRLL